MRERARVRRSGEGWTRASAGIPGKIFRLRLRRKNGRRLGCHIDRAGPPGRRVSLGGAGGAPGCAAVVAGQQLPLGPRAMSGGITDTLLSARGSHIPTYTHSQIHYRYCYRVQPQPYGGIGARVAGRELDPRPAGLSTAWTRHARHMAINTSPFVDA